MHHPPTSPMNIDSMHRTGTKRTKPIIFGNTMKLAEFMPIMSSASICSVTRMVPISEAMLLPTFPARISDIIDEENSRSSISLVASPVEYEGIRGDTMLMVIWMVITAPMNIEIMITSGMESTPSLLISLTIDRANTLHLSGRRKTCVINMQYLPNDFIDDIIISYAIVLRLQNYKKKRRGQIRVFF